MLCTPLEKVVVEETLTELLQEIPVFMDFVTRRESSNARGERLGPAGAGPSGHRGLPGFGELI